MYRDVVQHVVDFTSLLTVQQAAYCIMCICSTSLFVRIRHCTCVCVCEGRECRIPSLSRRVTAEFIDFLLVFSVKLIMSIIAVEYGFEYVLHTVIAKLSDICSL